MADRKNDKKPEIREGMSAGEIYDAGGHVTYTGSILDRHGAPKWTPEGDLTIRRGEAKPENRA